MLKNFLCLMLSFCLLPFPQLHADQVVLSLPVPGAMVGLSSAFNPVMLKGLTVHKDNPFLLDFIVSQGDTKSAEVLAQEDYLRVEATKLIKYFMATLAIPEKDLWVNLSPYEKNRTVPEVLGQTDMGRDLLAQDYLLKQITASLIYPEKELGKKFWDRVYEKTQNKYGNIRVPVDTFNKVWIMADQAEVFERNQTVIVTRSHLKVMLEEDYLAYRQAGLAAQKNLILSPPKSFMGGPGKAVSGFPIQTLGNDKDNVSSQIIRDIILPEIEKEVNEGKNFANIRQIFNSIILATWYKNNLQQSLLNQAYSNHGNVKGIDVTDQTINQKIYQQYLEAYKKGVFNYIQDMPEQQPRKYFAGGVVGQVMITKASQAMAAQVLSNLGQNNLVSMEVKLNDAAMLLPFMPLFVAKFLENRKGKRALTRIIRDVQVNNGQVDPKLIIALIANPYPKLGDDLNKVIKIVEQEKDNLDGIYSLGLLRVGRMVKTIQQALELKSKFPQMPLFNLVYSTSHGVRVSNVYKQSPTFLLKKLSSKKPEVIRAIVEIFMDDDVYFGVLEGIDQQVLTLADQPNYDKILLNVLMIKKMFHVRHFDPQQRTLDSLFYESNVELEQTQGILNRIAIKVNRQVIRDLLWKELLGKSALDMPISKEESQFVFDSGSFKNYLQFLIDQYRINIPDIVLSESNDANLERGFSVLLSFQFTVKDAFEFMAQYYKLRSQNNINFADELYAQLADKLASLNLPYHKNIAYFMLHKMALDGIFKVQKDQEDQKDAAMTTSEAILELMDMIADGDQKVDDQVVDDIALFLIRLLRSKYNDNIEILIPKLVKHKNFMHLKNKVQFLFVTTLPSKDKPGKVMPQLKMDYYYWKYLWNLIIQEERKIERLRVPPISKILPRNPHDLFPEHTERFGTERSFVPIYVMMAVAAAFGMWNYGDYEEIKNYILDYGGDVKRALKTILSKGDSAMGVVNNLGGIDFQETRTKTNTTKDGRGVEFSVDAAMLERVHREGVKSLTPVILRVNQNISVWPLLGLKNPTL